jgi:putative transposase
MDKDSRNRPAESLGVFDETWFDPIEIGVRDRIRGFIEELVEAELNEVLGRTRYQRPAGNPGTEAAQETVGYRHGRRERRLLGSFGPVTISVPRARVSNTDGTSQEWRSNVLPRYARMTKQVGADRRRLSVWHQHAPGAACPGGAVQRRCIEGHGEPNLAESAGRLGRLVPPFVGG